MSALCDKCGQPVPMSNDAVVIEAVATKSPVKMMFYAARHFLPVQGCEGSPSRSQYIEGQPRDPRPEYAYNPEHESYWREAYAQVQAEYGSEMV